MFTVEIIIEYACNNFRIDTNFNCNEVKRTIANNTKTNDKHDHSNRIPELKQECKNSRLLMTSSLNSRYQLNFKNYIQELYKALIKECNYNLLDLNSFNTTLDFESLTSVTNRTLKAIKVLKNRLKD